MGSQQSQMQSLRMRSHAGVLPAARRQALALPVKQRQQQRIVRDVLVRVLSQSHDLEIGSKAPDFELLQVEQQLGQVSRRSDAVCLAHVLPPCHRSP